MHDTNTCQVCSAPAGDHLNLCITHTDTLVVELRRIPDLITDLEVTITRQNRTTAERNGGRSSTTPLPWNERASEIRSELWSTLNAWALDVSRLGEDERDHLVDVDQHDIPDVARWLARNISTLRQHGEAGVAHEQIMKVIQSAWRAIDRAPDRVFVGPCRATPEGQGEPCEEDLYGVPGHSHARCVLCRSVHDMAARREWMLEQISDLAAHSGELSIVLNRNGVPVGSSTIRKWASAGRLHVVSKDSRGRKYYRIGDVLDLIYEADERDAATTTPGAA